MGARKGQPDRAGGPGPGTRDVSLSRDEILATAFEILETEGIERLTVRALAAKLGGAVAALAVQAILNLVIGSVLVDRQLERQPAQRQTPEELWTADDVPDAPALLEHLTHPVDEEKLFAFSLEVLVRALVST